MLQQLLTRLASYVREQWHQATYTAATEGGAAGLEEALRDLTAGEVTVSVRIDGRTLRLTEDVQAETESVDLDSLDRPALAKLVRERGLTVARTATADDLRELLRAE